MVAYQRVTTAIFATAAMLLAAMPPAPACAAGQGRPAGAEAALVAQGTNPDAIAVLPSKSRSAGDVRDRPHSGSIAPPAAIAETPPALARGGMRRALSPAAFACQSKLAQLCRLQI
jgi:hypothetical protein